MMNEKEELSQLMRHLSHDLRNTLGSNAKLLQLMRTTYASSLDERGNRWLSLIEDEANSGLNKLKRFSDLVKLFNQKPILKSSNLQQLIINAVNELASELQISASQIEVDVPEDLTVKVDEGLIKQALKYIITNSFQHSLENSEDVKVQIQCEESEKHISIIIQDNGNRFRSGSINIITEAFRSGASNPENTGLGLNFTKQIAKLHNGYMELTEEDGPRLMVSLTLSK
ncbi:sensor histidine kinase [Glaciecola sp. 1036]|uniref:sensor histidine kinase n=1 Tax=Alteromonadaceae TaxID=72275 RepID=UPI003D06FDD0